MPIATLQRRESPLASSKNQIEILENGIFERKVLPRFSTKLQTHGVNSLQPTVIEILQVNLGYVCNQTCTHCHVDAGPDRKEVMTKETMQQIIHVLKSTPIKTLDVTGGAPELNPNFRWFIEEARPFVDEIIVRSNLTIFSANKRFNDLPVFFAENRIRVISSLPCYTAENTDRQRGTGVFDRSIDALIQLNQVGYAKEGSNLILDLVYNPQGIGLPGPQKQLEQDYKKVLSEDFGIQFNQLFTITNLPISRFLEYLLRSEQYETYMQKLVDAFNPSTLESVMCRNTISVGWDGSLYDCDFNQMLQLPTDAKSPQHIKDFDWQRIHNRSIAINQHCYGCTAGAGSSCQGSLL